MCEQASFFFSVDLVLSSRACGWGLNFGELCNSFFFVSSSINFEAVLSYVFLQIFRFRFGGGGGGREPVWWHSGVSHQLQLWPLIRTQVRVPAAQLQIQLSVDVPGKQQIIARVLRFLLLVWETWVES